MSHLILESQGTCRGLTLGRFLTPPFNRTTSVVWEMTNKISPIEISFAFFKGGVGTIATDLQELRLESLEYMSFSKVNSFEGTITELLHHTANLKWLIFSHSSLKRDAFDGIERFRDQSMLESIRFEETGGDFDLETAQELANALPNCKVFWNDERLTSPSETFAETSDSSNQETNNRSK